MLTALSLNQNHGECQLSKVKGGKKGIMKHFFTFKNLKQNRAKNALTIFFFMLQTYMFNKSNQIWNLLTVSNIPGSMTTVYTESWAKLTGINRQAK